MAGYLDLHNMITTPEQERKLLTEFARHMGHSDEEIVEKIHSFFVRKYF
jgi:predicted HAD superfamily phosphohydrolase